MDVTSKILSNNECEANIFAGKLLLVTCGLSLIFTLIILQMETFIDHQLLISVVLLGNVIRLLLCRHISVNKGKGAALKWFIVIYALIFSSTISVLIGEVLYIMFAFPILIMTRYYDFKNVFKTSAITIAWMWAFSFLMIPIGVITQTFSLYHIAFSDSVTITIHPGLLGLFNAIATAYDHLSYPTIISSIVSLNGLYLFIFIALTFVAAYIAKNGKKNINNEITYTLKEAEQKSKELDIINAITESIECFFFVNPTTGNFEFKAKNENTDVVNIARRLTKGDNFFENLKENIRKVVFSGDQEQCLQFFSKENLDEILKSETVKSIELRWNKSGKIIWVKHKAIRTTDSDGNNCVAISIENITPSKDALERSTVLAGLRSDLDLICYINITTGTINTISVSPIFENLFKDNGRTSFGISQFEKFRSALRNITILEDLPKDIDFFHTQSLLSHLARNKYISFNARIKTEDHYKWYRIKYSYDPSNEGAFVFGLINIDNIAKSQFKLGEFSAYEKMHTFTEAFSESFVAAYYINTENQNMQVFKQNAHFEKHYGFQKNYQAFINQYIQNEVYEEDKESANKALQPANILDNLQKKSPFSITLRTLSEGALKWIRVDIVQATDKKHVAIAFKDITPELEEKQQKERTLEIIDILSESYSELHYINLVDNTEINLTSGENIGKSSAPTSSTTDLHKTFKKLIEEDTHPDDRERLRQELTIDEIKRKLAHQKRYNVIFKRKYDDIYKYTEMTIAKPENVNKEPLGIAIGFVEVDSRHRAELEQQADINRVLSLAGDFEFIYDVDIDSGIYTESAKSKKNIKVLTSGISFDDDFYISVAQNIPILVYPEDRELLSQSITREYLLEHLAIEPSFELNYRNIIDGKILWYKMIIVKSGDWTKEHRMLMGIVNNDESHKKEAEFRKQLQYALTLAQSANRAKTAFLNNMSHDIRTPMNAIIGFTSLANRHIENRALVEGYLSKIEQSSDHLLAIINKVLDMSSIESGKIVLTPKNENLHSIISALETIVHADINAKEQEFNIESSNITNPNIVCDKLRLTQVFLNIITNAIKYTPQKGKITLTINESTTSQADIHAYEFRIKDNGIGMSEEFRKNAYEPFMRAQTSTVSGIQGTGLGLTITKSLVEMMDGQIEINSEENVGTEIVLSFNFRIHDNNVNEEHEQNAEPNLSNLKGKRILLVEDNELNREISSTILKEEGFHVDIAEDGSIALQMIKESTSNRYDIILMDIQMPVMDGYESTRQIRNLNTPYTDNIPIIALTANAFVEDKNAALKAGMNDHLAKPISIPELKKKLQKYLCQSPG